MKKLKTLVQNSKSVITNYSFVLLSALVATVSFIISNEINIRTGNNYQEGVFLRMGFLAILGNSLFFGLAVLGARYGKKLFWNCLGILLLSLYYVYLLPVGFDDWTILHKTTLLVSFILSHLFVSFAPFIRKHDTASFWHYNKNLFLRALRTILFSGVFLAGILLSIKTIEELFVPDLDNRFYTYTALALSIFGSCFIFLLFSRNGLSHVLEKTKFPSFLKFFVQYVLVPLLIIYGTILYLYGIKILVLWELPKGYVSLPIMVYCLVGVLAILLTYPLQNETRKNWIIHFSKWFYRITLPLLALLFVAIGTRLWDYGFTENRYYILVFGLWLCFICFYFIFVKKTSIRMIPISLFIVGLTTLSLPRYNVFTTTNRSQFNQFDNLLKTHNLFLNKDGYTEKTIAFDRPVQDSIAERISTVFRFLAKRNKTTYLKTYFRTTEDADAFFAKDYYYFKSQFTNQIKTPGLKRSDYVYFTIFSPSKAYVLNEWDYVIVDIFSSYDTVKKIKVDGDVFHITKKYDNALKSTIYLLKLKEADLKEWLELDLTELFIDFRNGLKSTYANENKNQVHPKELSIEHSIGPYTIKLIFDHVTINNFGDPIEVYMSNFYSSILLLKKTENGKK